MILYSYLTREVSKSFIAVFLVLVTIFVSQKFVQFLADASDGDIPGFLVMTLVALRLPQFAGLLLPLSLFLAILLAYGRMYAESEMTIFHACGISEWYVTRVTLVLSIVMMVLTGFVTLELSPWAKEIEYQVLEDAQSDAGLSTLSAGRFQRIAQGNSVVFVESIDRDTNEYINVFVAQSAGKDDVDPHKRNLVYASRGKVREDDFGGQTLVLEQGRRYETDDSLATSITEFKTYSVLIKERQVAQKRRKLTAVSTADLAREEYQDNLDAVAELNWRIAIPLSIPILTLIAVPLSSVNPRQGKFARMVPALLLYLGYYVLLIAGRSAIENGAVPTFIGLWWIHIIALGIGLTLLFKNRESGNVLRAKLRRRRVSR